MTSLLSENFVTESSFWTYFEEHYPHLLQSPHMRVVFRDLARKRTCTAYQTLSDLHSDEILMEQLEIHESYLQTLCALLPDPNTHQEQKKRNALCQSLAEAFYLELPKPISRWSRGESRERWMSFSSTLATTLLFSLLNYEAFLAPIHWLHWVSLILMPVEIAAASALLEPLGKNKFLSCLPRRDKKILISITLASTLAMLGGTLIDGLENPHPIGCNVGLLSAGIFALVTLVRLGWLGKELYEIQHQRHIIQTHLRLLEPQLTHHPEMQTAYLALKKAEIVAEAKFKNQRLRVVATGFLALAVFAGILMPHLLAATLATALIIKGSMMLASFAASVLSHNALRAARRTCDIEVQQKLQALSSVPFALTSARTPPDREVTSPSTPEPVQAIQCLW